MNNIFRNASLFLVALLIAVPASHAQVILTPTTLSAAIADSSSQIMTVGSITTVTGYTVGVGTVGFIDNEMVMLKLLPGGGAVGTTTGIIRGYGGTAAAPHVSGAIVWLGPPQAFNAVREVTPQGTCKRANQLYLPYINARAGVISDCIGGQWVIGLRTPLTKFRYPFPDSGGTAYTSLNTNGTSLISTETYCTEVNLPHNKLLTGIAILAGTTVATDNWLVILYDSAGNALANSAVAGAVTATSSTYQARAFTAKFYAVGPAQYYACFQSNGTTDTARMIVTGTQDTYLTKGQTAGTFGTVAALTIPTTFTTAVGPYVYLY